MNTYKTIDGLELKLETRNGYTYLPTSEHLRWARSSNLRIKTNVEIKEGFALAKAEVFADNSVAIVSAHQAIPLSEENAVGNAEQRAIGRALEFAGLALPEEVKRGHTQETKAATLVKSVEQTFNATVTEVKQQVPNAALGETVVKIGKYDKKLKDVKKEDALSYLDFVGKQKFLKAETQAKVSLIKEYFGL